MGEYFDECFDDNFLEGVIFTLLGLPEYFWYLGGRALFILEIEVTLGKLFILMKFVFIIPY